MATETPGNRSIYQWVFDATNNLAGETNATLKCWIMLIQIKLAHRIQWLFRPPITPSQTSQSAVLNLLPGTIVQFQLSTFSDGSSSNIVVQLFDHDKPATVQNFIHYIQSGAYTNMYF